MSSKKQEKERERERALSNKLSFFFCFVLFHLFLPSLKEATSIKVPIGYFRSLTHAYTHSFIYSHLLHIFFLTLISPEFVLLSLSLCIPLLPSHYY